MWHHATAYADHTHHPYYHPYAGHAVADHGGLHSATGWLMHTIIGGIIHGLIYGAIFRLFRGLSLGEVMVVAGLGIVLVGCTLRGRWLLVVEPAG